MSLSNLKTKNGQERLKVIKHKGAAILLCDFSSCERDEGRQLLDDLLAQLQKEGDGTVRLLLDVNDTTHDASMSTEWKRHLNLFNARLLKSSIVGISRLNRIALAGIRAYAGLMGLEKAVFQIQVFENRDIALEYLSSDK
jgi:hypothetical protein